MKVFIDGLIFGRQRIGGISRVWEEYARRLPAHGVDVHLLVPFRNNNYALARLLESGRYETSLDYLYWPVRVFERVPIRGRLLDWVHVGDDIDLFQSTYFSTPRRRGVPSVVMVHDLIAEKQRHHATKAARTMLDIRAQTLANASLIVAISESTRRDLLKSYPSLSPDRVRVVYNGVESERCEGIGLGDVNRRHRTNLTPEGYFLYVGRRNGYKNFDIVSDLLRAYPRYRSFRFLCVGGEDATDARSALAREGLLQQFSFIDYADEGELAALYRNAQALIYPSKYEGFGLPVLEAMCHACPVVCSNTSSLPEVGGDAAFYFEPDSPASLASALEQMLGMPRAEVAARSLKNIERFSWERSTEQLVALYRELLA